MKRSGRDESIQVLIHIYMEAMLGISLNSYLYLTRKNAMSFLIPLQIGEEGKTSSAWKQGRWERRVGRGKRWHKQCIHI
jgi:hypothetical protein